MYNSEFFLYIYIVLNVTTLLLLFILLPPAFFIWVVVSILSVIWPLYNFVLLYRIMSQWCRSKRLSFLHCPGILQAWRKCGCHYSWCTFLTQNQSHSKSTHNLNFLRQPQPEATLGIKVQSPLEKKKTKQFNNQMQHNKVPYNKANIEWKVANNNNNNLYFPHTLNNVRILH